MSQHSPPSPPPRESIPSRTVACWLACLTVQLGLQVGVFGAEYVVEGRIKYEIYSLSGGLSVEQEDDFTVNVKDCNWHIKKTPKRYVNKGKEQTLSDYGVVCSDGTNFYQVYCFNGGKSFQGMIGSGSTPFSVTDPKMLVLWYAYASGCHFAKQQDKFLNNPLLIFDQSGYAKDFRVRARWQLHDEAPFLPAWIAFDGTPRFESDAKRQSDITWPFTNVVYSVNEFVTNEGRGLPKKASLDAYAPNVTNKTLIYRSANIEIEAVLFRKEVVVDAFRPADIMFNTVSDMRTISSNTPVGLAFFNKQGWPDLEASTVRAKQETGAVRNPTDQRQSKWVRLIFVVLVLSPIVITGVWKLSGHNIKTTKT